MDQIDLALRFLARVQFLRESAQLFRSAPHLLHDTSCLSCAGAFQPLARQPLSFSINSFAKCSPPLIVVIIRDAYKVSQASRRPLDWLKMKWMHWQWRKRQ